MLACALALLSARGAEARPERVWIDTDAACGAKRYADVDDCFAITALVASPEVEVVGVSTVFGNVSEPLAWRTTGTVLSMLDEHGLVVPPVFAGAPNRARRPTAGSAALQRALAAGPLTIVALGPLTNVAAAVRSRPDLVANVREIVAVMGKEEGHIFHPSEGSRAGWLGHGPIFSDLNVGKDPDAVRTVLESGAAVTLTPYTLSRQVKVTGPVLADMAAQGGPGAWLATRSRNWLSFWRSAIGQDGFYPFDLLAADYVLRRAYYACTETQAAVRPDHRIGVAGGGPLSLLRLPDGEPAGRSVLWCEEPPHDVVTQMASRSHRRPATGRRTD